jgi:D-inositol-3-phosphate glycosyltransferase
LLRIGVVMYQTSLTKGQELVAERMVREFRRQGYDAFLITSIYEDWEPAITSQEVATRGGFIQLYDDRLKIPVIRVDSYLTTWPPRRIFFRNFIDILKHIVEEMKLNVLITHSTLWNGPEEVAKFMGWRKELIANGSIHEPMLFCHMSHFQDASDERYSLEERSYREAWNKFSLTRIVKDADKLLVTTPMEEEGMRRLGATDEQTFLFPAGIDDTLETYDGGSRLRDRYQLPKGVKLVTYLGTVEERKNALGLLSVAERLSQNKDIHFVIAGRLEGEYGEKVKEEAKKFQNVTVLGQVSDEDKAHLIRESYLNVSLSRAEALGIAQLEFMYGGIPVVTSGSGGQSWIIRNGETGVVVNGPEDVEGAANAILELTKRPYVRNKLGKAAAKSVSRFSLTRLIQTFSKQLVQEFAEGQEAVGLPNVQPSEKVLEAWVKDNYRVILTTERLNVIPLKKVREAASIPLREIRRVRFQVRALWAALAAGAIATLFLILGRILPGGWSLMIDDKIMGFASAYGLSSPLTSILDAAIIISPLAVASLVFVFSVRRGYLVLFGDSRKTFVPATFIKALRLANKLTPEDLFGGE